MKKTLCLIDGLMLGGAERQLIGLASLLAKKGYGADLAYYHEKTFYDGLLREKKVHALYVHTGKNRIGKLFYLGWFIRKGHYDIVITYKKGPNIIACLLKMLGWRFKLIVSDRYAEQTVTRNIKLLYLLYKWADFIVPNSYSQEKFICTQFPGLASKTVTITNYTETDCFTPVEGKECRDMTRVLTVARIAKQKNVVNYLHAIKQVVDKNSNVIFEWYGDIQHGEENYYAECMDTIRDLGIGRYVIFCSATHDVLSKYQECDVFCLPSLFEGYPNAVCEAMSCGKAILCSRVCDNPLIVNEGENGMMFDPKSVEEMSRVILKFLSSSKEERLAMGTRSRELAVERFSEEVFVDKYIKLIESQP